jgi:putative ABC transport system permease protein
MPAGVPLAWLQLTHEKRRLTAALAGVVFAVVLMLIQLGFESALLLSAGLLQSHLRADLILISSQYQCQVYFTTFTERRLYQALGTEGVESVSALYLGSLPFKNPVTHRGRSIFIMAFNPETPALDVPGLAGNLKKLQKPGAVLFDALSRREYGPIPELLEESPKVASEIMDQQVEVVGLFRLGTSFAIDGSLITSDNTYFRLMPDHGPGIVNVGLIRLRPGADARQVQAQLASSLPPDVQVLTRNQFMELERNYWATNTPVGFIFKIAVLAGLLIGCIIVYQILYTDVSSHLREYATLKAMGYTERFMFRVVMQQSFFLSILGFLPALLISQVIYIVTGRATLLPFHMTLGRIIVVYALTMLMCAASASLAVRRLKQADPAEIF